MNNVIIGWLLRRVVELGGIGVALVQLYLALPPNAQTALQAVLSGDRSQQNLILAIGGLVVAGGGYVWSLRATTIPQVVTPSGEKITPKSDSIAMGNVVRQAEAAPKHETLWEKWTSRK